VRVNVRLTAPGAAPAAGPVTVRIGQKLAEATLVDGRAVVTIADLAPGDRFLRVRYAGSDTVAAGRVVQPITVR
jgi:hypothetical protein